MTNLTHIIYASRATDSFTEEDLQMLLTQIREKNAKAGVTGMLLHCESSFFQILEGHPVILDKLFEVINKDSRHEEIVKIIEEPIEERAFSDWSMGYARATRNELQSIDGLNDFFLDGQCMTGLDEGRSRKLLAAYGQGRWRQAG